MASDISVIPSVAIFSSQSKAPEEEHLRVIRSLINGSSQLIPLLETLKHLPRLWSLLSEYDGDLAALSHGPRSLQAITNWILMGYSDEIRDSPFGIVALPLLAIVQLVQYHHFLREKRLKHVEFITAVRNGAGVHGYCSGLLPAIAVACSATDEEFVENACRAVRLAVGLGAYGDFGGKDASAGPTMMAMRLDYSGQGEEIVESFPNVRPPFLSHGSGCTDV